MINELVTNSGDSRKRGCSYGEECEDPGDED